MKTSTPRLLCQLPRRAATGLAALLLLATLAAAHAAPAPFSRIFVFGDSLSDTGNFYQMTGGYPPPPYSNGRFSNGRLWVEHVAAQLSMEIQPGDNYAVAGATTGRDNGNDGLGGLEFPGLQDQVDAFQAAHGPGDSSGALFLLWAGANDFFVALQTGASPQQLISNGVANTAQAVLRLRQQGAQHIVVVNVPDLGLTPFARESGLSAPLTQLCAAYNQVLAATLDTLAGAGIQTVRVDAFATLGAMVASPGSYGFTNVTDACLLTGGNADTCLFWDAVHPTTRGHAVLAAEAVDRLVAFYSPSRGVGNPSARVHALSGLVRAQRN